MPAAIATCLPAGRGAEIENLLARSRVDHQRHELRRFVLDEERFVFGCAQRVAGTDRETVRRIARWRGLDVVPREDLLKLDAADAQRVRSKRERGSAVVELHPRFGPIESVAIQPPGDEPVGMRARHAEIGERARAVVWRHGSRRQRQSVSLTQQRTENGVDEAGGARLSCRSRQAHGIVHDGGRRHAIEVQELIEAETEDRRVHRGSTFVSGRLAKWATR